MNNREPILAILKRAFSNCSNVLEIGSGTGQHAVYFAEHLSHLHWQTSDLTQHHAGIQAWIDDYSGDNIGKPITIDVQQKIPPLQNFDAIFSANTAHIMSWEAVKAFIRQLPMILCKGGFFALYGPFNYEGKYTSDSNQAFDDYLKEVNPLQGIRDFEAVNKLAADAGLSLVEDNAMPANNRLILWQY